MSVIATNAGPFAYPAPVVRNEDGECEIVMMRCSCHHHGLVDTGHEHQERRHRWRLSATDAFLLMPAAFSLPKLQPGQAYLFERPL
jgi:hypothetical protein